MNSIKKILNYITVCYETCTNVEKMNITCKEKIKLINDIMEGVSL